MKFSTFCVVIFFLIPFSFVFGQQAHLSVIQDKKIEDLLELKMQLAKENKLTDAFTVQLFYGELKEANSIIREYNRTISVWPATIIYETPNYKVWVGNFFTRLEADRALLEIQKNFPNAFVLKPERRN